MPICLRKIEHLLSIDNNNAELVEFTNSVLSILDNHASIKRKHPCKQFCVHDKRSQSSNNAKV